MNHDDDAVTAAAMPLAHIVAKAAAALLFVAAAAAAARQPCEHDSSPISFVDRSSLLYYILLIPLPTTAAITLLSF